MGIKIRSIKEINKNWVKRKSKYEKLHKYGGDPFMMIDRVFAPLGKENSTVGFKTQN